MLSKGALPLEKTFIRNRKQEGCETCSLKLKTAETFSWFCCRLEILDIYNIQIFRKVFALTMMSEKGLWDVPEVLPFLFHRMLGSSKVARLLPIKISRSRKHLGTSKKQTTYLHVIYVFKSLFLVWCNKKAKIKHGLYLSLFLDFIPKPNTSQCVLHVDLLYGQVFWSKLKFLIFKTQIDFPLWAH